MLTLAPRTRFCSEGGFSLVEVLVTALIVALIGTAAATALGAANDLSGDQRYRSEAYLLAQQDQERMMSLSDQQLSGYSQTRPVSYANGYSFTVTSTASFIDTSGSASCTTGASAYYKIVSTVSWSEGSHAAAVTSVNVESTIARPLGNTLMTNVVDQSDTAGLQGVTVTATGPGSATTYVQGQTDGSGCSLLDALTAGSYAVTLSKQGYVDINGNSSPPNLNATVSSTGVTRLNSNPQVMGRAGTINASFATGEADSISWTGAGGTLATTSDPAESTAPAALNTSVTSRSLFPFESAGGSYSNNYTVWAGPCMAMEPPAADLTRASVLPGATASVTVTEPLLDVQTVTYNQAPVQPQAVKLIFTDANAHGCASGTAPSDSWSPEVVPPLTGSQTEPATGWLQYPGQPFMSDLSGANASASGDSGQLEVCAEYHGDWGSISQQSNTNFSTVVALPTIAITSNSSC